MHALKSLLYKHTKKKNVVICNDLPVILINSCKSRNPCIYLIDFFVSTIYKKE